MGPEVNKVRRWCIHERLYPIHSASGCMLCTNSTDFLSIASRVEDQMALAVTASSLRGEFSTSGFVFSNSSPKRNSYKAKKHRSGQSKQSPGGGGGSVSGARGISPQVSTGESAGKTLGTGQTTSAGSTVVQPPPTLAPSRPALHKLVLLLLPKSTPMLNYKASITEVEIFHFIFLQQKIPTQKSAEVWTEFQN